MKWWSVAPRILGADPDVLSNIEEFNKEFNLQPKDGFTAYIMPIRPAMKGFDDDIIDKHDWEPDETVLDKLPWCVICRVAILYNDKYYFTTVTRLQVYESDWEYMKDAISDILKWFDKARLEGIISVE